jgi:protease-4
MSDNSLMEKVAIEYLKEKKGKRRARYFKIFLFILVVIGLIYFSQSPSLDKKPHVALIEIKGPIFDSVDASAENLYKSLQRAYQAQNIKAVALRINSPGGSPVQSDMIYQEIMRYRKKYPKIKVYAICDDVCASGAYYIASSADEIYANQASLVGSIGVIFNGFGFVEAMQKLGIERRLVTAGNQKAFLDPFSKEKPEQVKELKNMLNIIHQQFIDRVKEGRGKRLSRSNEALFSGRIWTGEQAKNLGLIDGFGGLCDVTRNQVKVDSIIDYTYKEGLMDKVFKQLTESFSLKLFSQLSAHPLKF